jgi:hypothetical protein
MIALSVRSAVSTSWIFGTIIKSCFDNLLGGVERAGPAPPVKEMVRGATTAPIRSARKSL